MAPCAATGARLVSYERDWKWALAGKRFLWQARGGDPGSSMTAVDVRWGDATVELPKAQVDSGRPLVFLLAQISANSCTAERVPARCVRHDQYG